MCFGLLDIQEPQVAALFATPPTCDYSVLTKAVESILHLLRFAEVVVVAGNQHSSLVVFHSKTDIF